MVHDINRQSIIKKHMLERDGDVSRLYEIHMRVHNSHRAGFIGNETALGSRFLTNRHTVHPAQCSGWGVAMRVCLCVYVHITVYTIKA